MNLHPFGHQPEGFSFSKISLPAILPESLRAEHRRKNALSFFKKNSLARKSGKQGAFFFGVRRVREAVARRNPSVRIS